MVSSGITVRSDKGTHSEAENFVLRVGANHEEEAHQDKDHDKHQLADGVPEFDFAITCFIGRKLG